MIQDSIDRGYGNPKVTGMILLIAAISFIGIGIFGLINHIIEYNLAKKDFETYKKHVIELEDIAINNAKFDMEVNLIKCPNCGSKNTKKISTTSRVTSVAMLGVASGKIGKQYECKQCKYKW
nr:MAG TPA: transcription factor IIS-like protein [Caudoviricetes sp.]